MIKISIDTLEEEIKARETLIREYKNVFSISRAYKSCEVFNLVVVLSGRKLIDYFK